MKTGKRRIARPGDLYNGNVVLAEDGHDRQGYVMVWIQCGRCGGTHRTRRAYLTTPNRHYQTRSCGCGAKAQANAMIDKQIQGIDENLREKIAKEVEIKPALPSVQRTALHFGITGKFATYVCHRIRKQWREALWQRLGPERMIRLWRLGTRKGLRTAQRSLRGTRAEMLAIVGWARRNLPGASAQALSHPECPRVPNPFG